MADDSDKFGLLSSYLQDDSDESFQELLRDPIFYSQQVSEDKNVVPENGSSIDMEFLGFDSQASSSVSLSEAKCEMDKSLVAVSNEIKPSSPYCPEVEDISFEADYGCYGYVVL